MGDPCDVPHGQPADAQAGNQQAQALPHAGQSVLARADQVNAIGQAGQGHGHQQEAEGVERLALLRPFVGDERRHQGYAQQADGQVDVEDPAPVGELGDEAAQRRAQHRGE